MSADGALQQSPVGLQYPLGPAPSSPTKAECIYHKCIMFADIGRSHEFWYSIDKIVPRTDIEQYIADLPPGSIYAPKSSPVLSAALRMEAKGSSSSLLAATIQTRLEFGAYAPAYILFELDPFHDWQFQTSIDAVTTKSKLDADYCDLKHVIDPKDPTTWVPGGLSPANPIPPGCRFAYFSIVGQDPAQPARSDGFNLNVSYPQPGGGEVKDGVDPDITNPGGPPHN